MIHVLEGTHANKFPFFTQVFLATPHSFALVNLKPLLPGHVLVCPSRPHARLTDLSAPEVTDLFTTVQRVQRMLARHYFLPPSASSSSSSPTSTSQQQQQQGSFNVAVQDGPEAGQTVAHVHVHVIPRARGGPAAGRGGGGEGDELYERMAGEEGNVGGALWDHAEEGRGRGRPAPGGGFDRIEDDAREARSMEDMEAEAETFRAVLREMEGDGGA